MKLNVSYTYDIDARAMYIQLLDNKQHKVNETIPVKAEVNLDYDAVGSLVGIEILLPKKGAVAAVVKKKAGRPTKRMQAQEARRLTDKLFGKEENKKIDNDIENM